MLELATSGPRGKEMDLVVATIIELTGAVVNRMESARAQLYQHCCMTAAHRLTSPAGRVLTYGKDQPICKHRQPSASPGTCKSTQQQPWSAGAQAAVPVAPVGSRPVTALARPHRSASEVSITAALQASLAKRPIPCKHHILISKPQTPCCTQHDVQKAVGEQRR